MQLYEKYRPAALTEYAGHAATVAALDAMMSAASWDRDVLWFSGASGVGKTTLARLVAQRVLAGKDLARNLAFGEISGEQVDVAFVGSLAYEVRLSSPDPSGWRVWLVNEDQQVTPNARRALKTVLEGLPVRRLLLFTSTKGRESGLFGNMDEDEARQLWSRVKFFDLDDGEEWLAAAAARTLSVSRAEGLNGQPLAVYLALARECKGNLREMLQCVEMRRLPAAGGQALRAAVPARAWVGAEHLIEHAKARAGLPPEPPPVCVQLLGPLTHTKKGFPYWLVVPNKRVDKEAWLLTVEQAKASGGWYSSAWGGTPGGYAFKEKAGAEAFAKVLEGTT